MTCNRIFDILALTCFAFCVEWHLNVNHYSAWYGFACIRWFRYSWIYVLQQFFKAFWFYCLLWQTLCLRPEQLTHMRCCFRTRFYWVDLVRCSLSLPGWFVLSSTTMSVNGNLRTNVIVWSTQNHFLLQRCRSNRVTK